jgi:hypothetical protein
MKVLILMLAAATQLPVLAFSPINPDNLMTLEVGGKSVLQDAAGLVQALSITRDVDSRIILHPGIYTQDGSFRIENRSSVLVLEAAESGSVILRSTASDGLVVRNVSNLVLRNISFSGSAFNGGVFTSVQNVLETGVHWDNNGVIGKVCDNISNVTFRNCTANNNGRLGFKGDRLRDVLMEDCESSRNNQSRTNYGTAGWDGR